MEIQNIELHRVVATAYDLIEGIAEEIRLVEEILKR